VPVKPCALRGGGNDITAGIVRCGRWSRMKKRKVIVKNCDLGRGGKNSELKGKRGWKDFQGVSRSRTHSNPYLAHLGNRLGTVHGGGRRRLDSEGNPEKVRMTGKYALKENRGLFLEGEGEEAEEVVGFFGDWDGGGERDVTEAKRVEQHSSPRSLAQNGG